MQLVQQRVLLVQVLVVQAVEEVLEAEAPLANQDIGDADLENTKRHD
jgi:hypothetical protein